MKREYGDLDEYVEMFCNECNESIGFSSEDLYLDHNFLCSNCIDKLQNSHEVKK